MHDITRETDLHVLYKVHARCKVIFFFLITQTVYKWSEEAVITQLLQAGTDVGNVLFATGIVKCMCVYNNSSLFF